MKNKKEFINLLTLTQEELFLHLELSLDGLGYKKIVSEDALAFISPENNQALLVAHLDTINTKGYTYTYAYGSESSKSVKLLETEKTPKVEDILATKKYIMLSPEHNPSISCLGADDRVGVKTILDILGKGKRPHLLFTTDEESGCVGSRALINDEQFSELSKATMMIQIDRGVHEGYWNEMVFYSYDHKSLPGIFNELSKYFTLATGSYTDVAVLGPHFNKPIVNISASYENEHTTREFINLEAYDKNLEGLYKFLLWAEKQDTSEWVYTEKPLPKVSTYYKGTYKPKPFFGDERKRDKTKSPKELLDEMYASQSKIVSTDAEYDEYVLEAGTSKYIDFYIEKLYEKGLKVWTLLGIESILDGTTYFEVFTEVTEEEKEVFGDEWEEVTGVQQKSKG